MMKSIAFNDTANPADEEGFVIVDSPQGFSSILEDDEESYDHCDDAFSFSSLHQNLPVSSLPMESVQDNFFEPPIGQEVVPPAVPSSPSLLSEYDDDDEEEDDDDPPVFATEDYSKMKVVIPRIDSDVEGLCALVSSLPSSFVSSVAHESKNGKAIAEPLARSPASGESASEEAKQLIPSLSFPSNNQTSRSEDEKEDGCGTTGRGSTEEEEDEAGDDDSADKDEPLEDQTTTSSRASKKKRRKQLKLSKKAAAAAAAAAALGHFTLRSTTPKRKGVKNRKKVANIAVSCAVQSIAEYKEEVERKKITKKIR